MPAFHILIALVSTALLVAGPGLSPTYAQDQKTFVLDGDMAIWTVAIKADKTAQFEDLLGRLRTALQSSDKPERRQQGQHWRVLKMSKPLDDGNIGYIHVVSEPVPNADYAVLRILYESFPEEARALYDRYLECFAANVSLVTATLVADMATHP